MFNEIMNYLNNHPEKADMILVLTPCEKRSYSAIFCETRSLSSEGSVATVAKREAIQPEITMEICNGVPVYTVMDGAELIARLPIDKVTPIRTEHKEFDNSNQKGAVMEFSYDGAVYTMEVLYSEE